MAWELLRLRGLVECRVSRRANRFVVEARGPRGELLRVHNRNTGRLVDVLYPGARVLCLPLPRPGRTSHRLVGAWYNGGWAVVDTGLQEEAFARAVELGLIPWLRGCRVLGRRPRLGSSVLDFLLDCGGSRVYVETKSAVLLSGDGYALYPDCPTERGRRHIRELIEHARRGVRVALVFIAALPGARGFRPNAEGDPEIPGLVAEAVRAGVLVKSIGMDMVYSGGEGAVRLYSPDLPVEAA